MSVHSGGCLEFHFKSSCLPARLAPELEARWVLCRSAVVDVKTQYLNHAANSAPCGVWADHPYLGVAAWGLSLAATAQPHEGFSHRLSLAQENTKIPSVAYTEYVLRSHHCKVEKSWVKDCLSRKIACFFSILILHPMTLLKPFIHQK